MDQTVKVVLHVGILCTRALVLGLTRDKDNVEKALEELKEASEIIKNDGEIEFSDENTPEETNILDELEHQEYEDEGEEEEEKEEVTTSNGQAELDMEEVDEDDEDWDDIDLDFD